MIRIITDSTAYMPEDFVKKNNIIVVPLHYIFMDKEWFEGYAGTYDEFFAKFCQNKQFPKTSQPALTDFLDAYEKVLQDGDEAIVFTISANLSGTNNVAKLAQSQCSAPEKIHVVDSEATGQVIWGYCMEVVKLQSDGKTIDEILEHIAELKKESSIYFVPDSLEYLKRGGRIGKISATLGSILQIKPLLAFKQGILTCKKKIIGVARAIGELVSQIPEKIKRLFVIHIADTKYYDRLKTEVNKKYQGKGIDIVEGELGPVVASHIGPAFGICYIK